MSNNFAGACDRPADRCRVVPEAHFKQSLVQKINHDLFGEYRRSPDTTDVVHEVWRTLERALRAFVRDFAVEALIVENALSLPMNVPLRLALSSLIAETNIPTIARLRFRDLTVRSVVAVMIPLHSGHRARI
jgi:hypothetical protein